MESSEVVGLVEEESSVGSVSSAGVEEDEVEPTEVDVLSEVVASEDSVSSAGVEEDEVESSEVVGLVSNEEASAYAIGQYEDEIENGVIATDDKRIRTKIKAKG